MKYAKKLRKGDKVAIVSLSSGMLGEAFCSHNIEIGVKRLREYGLEPSFMPNSLKGIEYLKANPKARAKDLKDAFMDDSIAGIICAIGGDDTYRLLPYLLEDGEFIDAVHKSPKLFTGFSDTTINHLMFYKLGLSTYYGPNFICDLAEISDEMLPYSKKAFESYIEGNEYREITSSEIWYQERTDFSKEAVGTERISHKEEHGFELLQGKDYFEGRLLGGCLESLYDILTTTRYEDEKAVCEKYGLFPDIEEWKEKILFIETCEEKPVPEQFEKEVAMIKKKGVFDVVSGVLVGKPQDEEYYEEYKDILVKVVNDPDLPIVYNVNFGHATPRCVLQYGAMARVDMKQKKIKCEVKILPYFGKRKLDDIRTSDVIQWQNEIMKLKKDNGELFSPTYLKTIHNQLSAILNNAVNLYGLKDNVARKAGTMGKEENKEMEFWTQDEFQAFLECVTDKPISYYAFEMLYWTGIREGELLALTPADFNFEKKTLQINKSYQRLEGKDVITDPKTPKSNRTIVMPDFLAVEMEDFISSLYGIKDDDRIFTISKSYLHHEMDRGAKLAGVKRIRIHGLRHSHISLLINLGFSALAIGERVRHEAVDITYHYAHLFPTVQTDMAVQLETEREALVNVRKE